MVGIVVVNYFGGDLTLRCLESLEDLTWPVDRLAVALVDNGSKPGYLDGIRGRFPAVRVVEAGSNLGFGGACNRGFEVLHDCQYIALLNNDAVPEPDWLEPLVEVLEADPGVGAAIPKILLTGRFVSIELRSATVRPGGGDGRALGVQLCGARIDGEDISDRIQLVSGFWGWEHDAVTVGGSFTWSNGHGVARLPAGASGQLSTVELRLASGQGRTDADVSVGEGTSTVPVDVRPKWTTFEPGELIELVNSAGTFLHDDGSVADRGYLEVDGHSFDAPAEVFGWSGAAVVLPRRFLDEVGVFDEPLFLYYEDADLSWRGRLQGWTYRYEPRSVVRHQHSATVGDRSTLARHVAARNRLVMLTKCAPARMVRSAAANAIRQLATAAYRDLLRKPLALERPVFRHVVADGRVLAGYLALLPHALRGRRRARSSPRVTSFDAEIAQWLRSPSRSLH